MITSTAEPHIKEEPGVRSGRGRPLAEGLAFVGGLALVLLYGLRGGGSYDPLIFQENGLIVWWLLALCFALGLFPRSLPSRRVLLFMAALLLYGAWTALSLTWTDSSELTGTEVARVIDYLGLVVLVASGLDRQTWRPALAGLICGGFVICVVAAGSRLAPSIFGVDHVDAVLHQDRLSVPFGYWNAVGAFAAMCAAAGLAWSAHDRLLGRRVIALAFVPVAGLATYLTYSRAGIVDIAVGAAAVLILSRNRITSLIHALVGAASTGFVVLAVHGEPEIAHRTGTAGASTVGLVLVLAMIAGGATAVVSARIGADRWRIPRRAGRILLALAGVVIIVAAVAFGPKVARDGWHSFSKAPPSQASAAGAARLSTLSGQRYQLWKVTLHAFEAHPTKGIGAGTFQFWWNQHATDNSFLRDAHSIWFQNMAELGWPGLLLIIAVAVSAFAVGIGARRAARRSASGGAATAVLAVFIVFLVAASVDWMWESTTVAALALVGIAGLGVRLGRDVSRLRIPLRIVLVLAALGAGVIQLPGILSTSSVRKSQSAQKDGDPNGALSWAKAAVNAEPWSATAYQQLGLVEESADQLAPAAADLRRAISREPQNYIHWLLLARVETERGQLARAVRAYNRARHLRPRASVFS